MPEFTCLVVVLCPIFSVESCLLDASNLRLRWKTNELPIQIFVTEILSFVTLRGGGGGGCNGLR